MRIISKTAIRDYYTRNPLAKAALLNWVERTETAQWHNFADIKKTFNSVDSVGNQRYVFNIKGFIGTHAEYDKIKDIKNI